MNFLADENIDRQIVERLRQEGRNVQYVAETDAGISDNEILIRLAGYSPMRKAEIVASSINKHTTELLRAFTVITRGAIRIRHEIG